MSYSLITFKDKEDELFPDFDAVCAKFYKSCVKLFSEEKSFKVGIYIMTPYDRRAPDPSVVHRLRVLCEFFKLHNIAEIVLIGGGWFFKAYVSVLCEYIASPDSNLRMLDLRNDTFETTDERMQSIMHAVKKSSIVAICVDPRLWSTPLVNIFCEMFSAKDCPIKCLHIVGSNIHFAYILKCLHRCYSGIKTLKLSRCGFTGPEAKEMHSLVRKLRLTTLMISGVPDKPTMSFLATVFDGLEHPSVCIEKLCILDYGMDDHWHSCLGCTIKGMPRLRTLCLRGGCLWSSVLSDAAIGSKLTELEVDMGSRFMPVLGDLEAILRHPECHIVTLLGKSSKIAKHTVACKKIANIMLVMSSVRELRGSNAPTSMLRKLPQELTRYLSTFLAPKITEFSDDVSDSRYVDFYFSDVFII